MTDVSIVGNRKALMSLVPFLLLIVLSLPLHPGAVDAAPATGQMATLGPGPKVTLQWVAQSIPTNLQYTLVEKRFAEEIARRSNGRVEVRLATWAELSLTGFEILRLTRQGQVEVGGAPFTNLAGDVPLLDIVDLPGLNPTIAQARKVLDVTSQEINRALALLDVKLIGSWPFPANVFFCRVPVRGLEDMRGKRIRTFGPALPDLVRALGAQSVTVAFPELYTATERGVIDCLITGTASANQLKLYEVTTHIYSLPVTWSTSGYLVNLRWWTSLPSDVRRFLEETFKEITAEQWKLGERLTQDGIDCNTGSAACQYGTRATRPMVEVKPTDEARTTLRRILGEVVIPGWVRRCGERCGSIYNRLVAPITNVPYGSR